MKPCSKSRKLIAWLAVDALDANQARALRAHIGICAGCRRYLQEISDVTERLAVAEIPAEIQASKFFHQKVIRTLEAEEKRSTWETAAAYLAMLNWRVALPVIAAVAVLIAVLFNSGQRRHVSLQTQSSPQPVPAQHLERDLQPTFSNYRMVANRSLDKLDELLTSQANKNLPSAPIYTASTLTTSHVS